MSGNRYQYLSEIEVAELHQLIKTDESSFELIDIRSHDEACQASIPGSRNIPRHDISLQLSKLATDKTVILYCQLGEESARTCLYLANQGMDNTINLRGGFEAWKLSGLKVA